MQRRDGRDALDLAVRATRALASAASVPDGVRSVLEAVCAETGWTIGSFFRLDRTKRVLHCERVYVTPGAEVVDFVYATMQATFAAGVGLPGRVLQTEAEHWVSDVANDENFPRKAVAEKCGLHGAAGFPIFAGREVVGVVEFFSEEIRTPDDRLLDVLGAVASQLGQFLERKRAEDTTHFLSEASAALAASLDHRATLEKLAKLAVPFLCDWCAIDVERDGGRFDRVAVAHVHEEKTRLIVEVQKRWPPAPDVFAGYPKVMRTGKADFYPEGSDAALRAAAKDDEHYLMMRELGYRSFMCVPLIARGRTLGAMTLVIADPGRRPFRESDLLLSEDLAQRAGLAIDNARLFEEAEAERRRAKLLAEASRLLVESLDHRATVSKVAKLVVPELGDLCVIHLAGEDGEPHPTAVGVAHMDPEETRSLEEKLKCWPVPAEVPRGIASVMRSGKPELWPVVDDAVLERDLGSSPEYLRFIRDVFKPRSTMIVPLSAQGTVIGTLTLSRVREGFSFSERDLPLARDLADRIALSVSNSRFYERAEAAVRARDEFLSIASHELRTPLTALQLVVRMLRMEETNRQNLEHLDIAASQLDRIAKLIAMLFDISRVTSGKLALEVEDVDLASVVKDVVERFKPDLQEARCAIEVHTTSVVGRWDRFRLEQVVTNLLANAVKFGKGKPIHILVEPCDRGARLVVRDHGLGIAPEALPRIFERFSRGKAARTYDGLGLGLYIVRQILDAKGGTISVESKPNEGAIFRVELPLAPERR